MVSLLIWDVYLEIQLGFEHKNPLRHKKSLIYYNTKIIDVLDIVLYQGYKAYKVYIWAVFIAYYWQSKTFKQSYY